MICVPIFALLQSFIMDWMNKKTNITVPLVLLFKAVAEIVSNYLIFYQRGSFNLAVAGLYIDFSLTKGCYVMYAIMLETIVDENAASYSSVIIAISAKVLI